MLNLLPTPKELKLNEEKFYTIKSTVAAFDSEWEDFAEFIRSSHLKATYFELGSGEGGIELHRDDSIKGGEYKLVCDGKLSAYASDYEGMSYATASIIQLTSEVKPEIKLPEFEIYDYADKEYRAFMADLARAWHPFRQLLVFVDLCALYKIKYLQLHFIDTELYTLPSDVFPNLPTKGMHYTKDEIRELREYAKKRNVILVPEFECPGHGSPFTIRHPETFANKYDDGVGERFLVDGGFEVDVTDLICAGSEKCTEGVYALIREMVEMFPDSPYIHIGGDEAAIQLWDKCPTCREYMRKNKISGVYELYCEYVGRIAKFVLSLGKTPIVWEGFSKEYAHHVPKETIVVAWESLYNLPEDLLADGFKIINAAWNPLYVVAKVNNEFEPARGKCFYGTKDILDWDIYTWRNWSPLSEATLNPITISPTDDLLGTMLCSWGQTYEQEINLILENLLTMSERVWNIRRVLTEDEFIIKQGVIIQAVAKIIQER